MRRNILKLTVIVTGSAGLLLSGCHGEPQPRKIHYDLKPPFNVTAIRADLKKHYTKTFRCERPPKPMKDLFFESMYEKSSKNASVVDPVAYKKYKQDIKPLTTLETGLSTTANKYVESNPPRSEIAECVTSWMSVWADAHGMMGKDNHTGEFLRKWILASVSMAYVQVRDDPYISPDTHKNIETWIRHLSERVMDDFSKHPDIKSRNNNHMYWAAWGVMAAGIALDDRKMFDWGLYEAKVGIFQIEKDGTLPLEVARGQKAFNYHQFAAIPLFMMAETAYANGINLYDMNDQGLKRLARLILNNVDDQSYFVKLTGKKQDMHRAITSSNLVWLEIYRRHYDDLDADRLLAKFRPVKHSRVGGDATLLYGKLFQ